MAIQVEGLTGVWIEIDQPAVGSDLKPYSAQSLEPGPMLAKLAAIGVKVDAMGVSRHGFALNVNPDMRYWEGIVGCGLPTPEISLADLLEPVPAMEAIEESFVEVFGKIFEYEIKYVK